MRTGSGPKAMSFAASTSTKTSSASSQLSRSQTVPPSSWSGRAKALAQWIRGGDPLSLDLMRRFGEHLLSAVDHLEQEGIAHRDIKPDNIGISKVAGTGAYRLVLFDFSLSRAPLETLTAGTRPYLEPFLPDRRPPRWDLHAERYAVAVTLHEMWPLYHLALVMASLTRALSRKRRQ